MFDTFNEQASARQRYLTPRPEPSGVNFTQAEGQQIRWHFAGLLVGEFEAEPIANVVGIRILAPNVIGREPV